MSNSVEDIVRPFAVAQTAPPRQYFASGQVGVPPVIIRAGRGGQGRTFTGSYSSRLSNYMTRYVNEKRTASFGTTV